MVRSNSIKMSAFSWGDKVPDVQPLGNGVAEEEISPPVPEPTYKSVNTICPHSAAFPAPIGASKAVSYTHLDVYKRQIWNFVATAAWESPV